MALNQIQLAHLTAVLDERDVRQIEDNARIAERIEQRWRLRVRAMFERMNERVLDAIVSHNGSPSWGNLGAVLFRDAADLFLQHEFETTVAAANTVGSPDYVRAARAPKWPNDTVRIRAQWDQWRRTGKLPGKTREQAAAVKVLYIRHIQTLWQKRGNEFIRGTPKTLGFDEAGMIWNPDAFDREKAKKAIEDEALVSRARASTIVETETTRYYNTTRVNAFNAMDNVVAYYFVCVRDHATTPWCLSRRHAVFTKGSALLSKNTPPCHWNCRSELLPLSKNNPAHRRLLDDPKLRAETRTFVPLPPGWNEAA